MRPTFHASGRLRPPPGIPVHYSHPLGRGLQAVYLFNEGAGKYLNDANGNGGGPTASTWATALPGGVETQGIVGHFDGSTGFATIPNGPAVNFPADMTLLVLLRTNTGGTSRGILGKGLTAPPAQYLLFHDAGGTIAWYDGTATKNSTYNLSANQNVWLWVGAVRRGTSLAFYVNGRAAGTATVVISAANTEPLLIGRYMGSSPWSGQMSAVFLWNLALTPDQVAWHYAEPYGCFRAPRVSRSEAILAAFQPAWAKGANRLISGGVGTG